MTAGEWFERGSTTADSDDAGAVLRAWRTTNQRSQVQVAAALEMTQQRLSQIEKGLRPCSLELRRRMVEELGMEPEDLGLSSGQARRLASRDESPEVAASRLRWRGERRWLNTHRSELAQLAVRMYSADQRVPRTPLIAHPSWVPPAPVDLREIALALYEEPRPALVDGTEPATLSVRPLRSPDRVFDRYTSAIKHLDPPRLFDSRPSYRLLDVEERGRRLSFGMAAYFDKLDVSEALGHEFAAACMALGKVQTGPAALAGRLPFRDMIGDPFAPGRRAIIPAITTLTLRLRRFPAPPSFLLHWRDPSRVATAGGIYDVIPAGEFQPSGVALWDRRNDFDLWRNIVREYSEELLGTPEHDGTRTQPIDYDAWPLYQQLEDGRRDGSVCAFLLGLGLDALALAATILTVVVIDDDAFLCSFGETVRHNDEGEIVSVGSGAAAEGVPFTAESVRRLLESEPMASPGAACLALAWKHRGLLGL